MCTMDKTDWSLCWRLSLYAVIFIAHVSCAQGNFPQVLECDFEDQHACTEDTTDERCRSGVTSCNPSEGRPAYCMVKWQNVSGVVQVTQKGCWGDDQRCVGKTGCFEERYSPGKDDYFCCCEGQRCNTNYSYSPNRLTSAEDLRFQENTICEYYDEVECRVKPSVCNLTRVTCEPDPGKSVHCYALWDNTTGEFRVSKKGCWLDDFECMKSTCMNKDSIDREPYYCCCTGSMCNVDVVHQDIVPSELDEDITVLEKTTEQQLMVTLVYSLVPIIAVAFIILAAYWFWRRYHTGHEPIPNKDPSPIPSPIPTNDCFKPIQLLEVKARGRFGCVWKGQLEDQVVAVKVFPYQDTLSYRNEHDIYHLCYLSDHQNILRFIGGERRGDNAHNIELWLITEFHEKGSLYDYLKGNLITWFDCLKMAESMSRGLAFLHEEIHVHIPRMYKPVVAHRDFKSKNVLVKRDNSVCIADFGLALKFCGPVGTTHGQVGTRRYMAPEVLEGAINFGHDHFLHIDVYAMGLVLWELLSRCSAVDGPVEDYQLPFEDEVGQHPSLEDMQDLVIQRKGRPPFKQQWASHPGLASLYHTATECWDSDPDARLSAHCVEDRVGQIIMTPTTNQLVPILTTTNSQTPPKHDIISL